MMNKQTINTGKKSITHRQAPAAWLGGCLLSLGLVWAPPTLAAELTCGAAPDIEGAGMNCFKPNTAAKSGEVNANFKHLLDEIATLKARLAEVEGKLSAVSYDNNQKKLLIEGVNVQIVNGAGTTESTNSTGNLIIGYNEAATRKICSKGPYFKQADCEASGGTWAANQRQGSHNVVIGDEHQYTRHGGFVAGYGNVINGGSASVSGGQHNIANGWGTSISGGYDNATKGSYSSVSGGRDNIVNGWYASISGGFNIYANGEYSSVSGGRYNIASGEYASISGGRDNTASGEYASVSGGSGNTASGEYASVSGGSGNTASGKKASVSGGKRNKAEGNSSSVIGGYNEKATGEYDIAPSP